jgi:crotonobetainyl-CoA hydratase
VPLAELMAAARELAQQVCQCAPLSLMGTKAAINATEALTVKDAYAYVRGGNVPAYDAIHASEDAKEGPLAFSEGREPVWKGR